MAQWKVASAAGQSARCVEDVLEILATNRGITPEVAQGYYSPSLSSMSDSPLGSDLHTAARLLATGGNFAIVGDYDADGILSSAIIEMTAKKLGAKCSTFIPSRWKEGYGLNESTVKALLQWFGDKKPDVLFVLDCGSSSEDHVAALKREGVGKIIVIDHHIIDPNKRTRSADAHINWRDIPGCTPYCAAGEAMQVARKACMLKGVGWEWLLPYAAIATVGDVVPVTGDNRTIVRHGLASERVLAMESPGITSIVYKRCRSVISQKSMAFYVVPRLNAAGRMGDPKRAFDLVVERDQAVSLQLMGVIEAANDERKQIQDRIFRQGIQMVGGSEATPPFVFLHNSGWNIGVCGISCSQMVEKYGVPVMMFGTYEGKVRGSGRSVPGVNIKEILDGCGKGVFERHGGHEMACGATINGGMFAEARKRFGESFARMHGDIKHIHQWSFDMDLPPALANSNLGDALMDTFYPYCETSNPEPVFRLQSATIKSVVKDEFKAYIRLSVEVEKDGVTIPHAMSTFLKEGVDDHTLSLAEGDVADFYFSFPQDKVFNDGFSDQKYQLELVDANMRK